MSSGLTIWPVWIGLRATSTCSVGAATGASRCRPAWAISAARSPCSQARAIKAVAPATMTASSRKTTRLLFMTPAPCSSRCDQCRCDPQAAAGDRRAVGQAAAKWRAKRSADGGCSWPDRRAGKERKTKRAADQGRDREEVDHVRRPGEQACGRQQLHIAAPDDAASEAQDADGEHGQAADDRHAQHHGRQPAKRETGGRPHRITRNCRQRQAVGDLERAPILPTRRDQQELEGTETADLKKREQRQPTPKPTE